MIDNRAGGVPKNTTRDEGSELGGVWEGIITGERGNKGEVDNNCNLTKDSGDLALIKGVMVQGEAASGTRRVLKHRGSPTGV